MQSIINGQTYLGIELGSTRIKSVLIDENHAILASGGYAWENALVDGVWTYSLDDVWAGLQASYADLAANVKAQYGVELTAVKSIGISAMMHGYIAFGKNRQLLVPFRTWRNTTTEQAANALTQAFGFNIPQRWTVAHLYQAILNKESHVSDVSFVTTLAGYVHWKLTGQKVVGVGDASGIFPIDSNTCGYDAEMVAKFNKLTNINLTDVFPAVLNAGEDAGALTAEGAKLLDPSGKLSAGALLAPPEGDAGTGMVATNSVAERTGNISAGTSIFAMIVLEKALSKVHMEIDMVTTPTGKPVAMVHCNNCSSDIDAWVKLFEETLGEFGATVDKNKLYETLYRKALEGEADCGGVLTYNYYSGEPITGLAEGRPLLVRKPDGTFSLANVMRSLLFSAIGTLKLGMEILDGENVQLDSLLGHGGFFKTKGVGQKLMAAALGVPVTVMESAGEGGAWGIAILAAYRAAKLEGETLETYLAKVFAGEEGSTIEPCPQDAEGFAKFMQMYVRGLGVEKAAVELV